jgi:hypothetical protein
MRFFNQRGLSIATGATNRKIAELELMPVAQTALSRIARQLGSRL